MVSLDGGLVPQSMTYGDLSQSQQPQRSSATNRGEMSCATTLFVALLLIPLIFGGTLFLLNEVGQAYFGTDPISLPPQIAGAINRLGIASLPSSGETDAALIALGQSSGDPSGPPAGGNIEPSATLIPGGLPEPTGTEITSAGGTPGPSTIASASPSQSAVSPTATATPTPSGSPTASVAPSGTATRTPTSSATHLPTATATAPSGQPLPSSTPIAATATSGSCTVTFNNGYEGTVLDLINQERQDQGLPAYTTDSRLRSAALVHATDMACHDFFSHTGSDGSSASDRVSAQGYSWSTVGENIYAGSGSYGSPSSAFEGWMDSPGHRANILSTNFTQIGVGYVYFADSQYRNYYVTVFATPQ